MIRDDDLAWAERVLDSGGMLTEVNVLARLVLHIHEQDTPLPETLPPPEAVEWAQKIGNRSRPGWWNEGVYEAAMFILQAAGKDTDDE